MIIQSLAIRLIILAVLAIGCFTTGFWAGVTWEGNARDALELKRVKDVEIRIKEVIKVVTKIEKVFITRQVVREVEKERIVQEVDKHVETIPDPRECWLDPERVRVINDAAQPDGKPAQAAPVPGADPAAVGEPQRGAEVGGGHGLQVPRVLRQVFGAGGDGDGKPIPGEAQ